jgi:hypothetical protein
MDGNIATFGPKCASTGGARARDYNRFADTLVLRQRCQTEKLTTTMWTLLRHAFRVQVRLQCASESHIVFVGAKRKSTSFSFNGREMPQLHRNS